MKDTTQAEGRSRISTGLPQREEGMEEIPAQPRVARTGRKLPKSNPECRRHTQSHGDLDVLQEKQLPTKIWRFLSLGR